MNQRKAILATGSKFNAEDILAERVTRSMTGVLNVSAGIENQTRNWLVIINAEKMMPAKAALCGVLIDEARVQEESYALPANWP